MSDDRDWVLPGHKGPPPRPPKPRERLWSLRRPGDHQPFKCDVLNHGEFGVEAQILHGASCKRR